MTTLLPPPDLPGCPSAGLQVENRSANPQSHHRCSPRADWDPPGTSTFSETGWIRAVRGGSGLRDDTPGSASLGMAGVAGSWACVRPVPPGAAVLSLLARRMGSLGRRTIGLATSALGNSETGFLGMGPKSPLIVLRMHASQVLPDASSRFTGIPQAWHCSFLLPPTSAGSQESSSSGSSSTPKRWCSACFCSCRRARARMRARYQLIYSRIFNTLVTSTGAGLHPGHWSTMHASHHHRCPPPRFRHSSHTYSLSS
mmetsp:Transcript_61040/g.163747  ORF Transcript_61040/g.163747 Transcript_61040/m.163747 type:complete len:256 (-) Transcript_61040:432-1199(-)